MTLSCLDSLDWQRHQQTRVWDFPACTVGYGLLLGILYCELLIKQIQHLYYEDRTFATSLHENIANIHLAASDAEHFDQAYCHHHHAAML